MSIIGGVAVLFVGDDNPAQARRLALVVALAAFVLSIPLYTLFDPGTAAMQFEEQAAWVPPFNITYHLGVDGFAMGLELLSLSLYALVAFNRDSPVSAEAAMKYFVLGALASGLLRVALGLYPTALMTWCATAF